MQQFLSFCCSFVLLYDNENKKKNTQKNWPNIHLCISLSAKLLFYLSKHVKWHVIILFAASISLSQVVITNFVRMSISSFMIKKISNHNLYMIQIRDYAKLIKRTKMILNEIYNNMIFEQGCFEVPQMRSLKHKMKCSAKLLNYQVRLKWCIIYNGQTLTHHNFYLSKTP